MCAAAPVVAPTATVSSSRPTSVVLKVDPPTDPEDYGYMPVTSYDVQIGDTERVISFTAGAQLYKTTDIIVTVFSYH